MITESGQMGHISGDDILPLDAVPRPKQAHLSLLAMLEGGSTLVAKMKLGGFLTFSLRDELIVPANFFEPTDLLNSMGIATHQLYGVDRLPWRNPYVPTQEQLDRGLDNADFCELLNLDALAMRRGHPRKLPSWYNQRAGDLESIDYPLIARLVSPLAMSKLLKEILEVELVNRVPNPITRAKLGGIVLTMATTGMRLAEALRIRNGDILRIGSYETMKIRGTKVARARREVPLDVFCAGSECSSASI